MKLFRSAQVDTVGQGIVNNLPKQYTLQNKIHIRRSMYFEGGTITERRINHWNCWVFRCKKQYKRRGAGWGGDAQSQLCPNVSVHVWTGPLGDLNLETVCWHTYNTCSYARLRHIRLWNSTSSAGPLTVCHFLKYFPSRLRFTLSQERSWGCRTQLTPRPLMSVFPQIIVVAVSISPYAVMLILR